MFKKRSERQELMDDLSLKHEALRKNLEELETINHWLGGRKLLIGALDKIYKKYKLYFNSKKIVIGDLGCGGGDLLRAMSQWAKRNGVDVELIGIDANPFMIDYAIEKSHLYPNLQYKVLNIFSPEFKKIPFDIVTINTVCHHFSNAELITLFSALKKQVGLAVIMNDLQRHRISYLAIRCLSVLFKFSYLAKHDGPLSVLRAFHKIELMALLEKASINFYQMKWRLAFRWEVIIWCKEN